MNSAPVARGKIRSRELALVERDFSGLCWKRITPTDIDGFVEFQDRLFVFIEGKSRGALLKGGQRLAIERLCDACHNEQAGRYSIAFVVAHDGQDCFDYATADVVEYRWRGSWIRIRPDKPKRLKEAIDAMRGKYLGNVVEFRDHAAWVADYEQGERGQS